VPEAAYGYDPAGNVISDAQRSLTYNAFNLPAMVTGAEGAEQAISYVGGTAFSRTNQDGEIRYYLDGLEVFKDKPASYSFAEGRLAFRDGEAHFQYRIADHLGNTVVLFEDKNDDGLITDNPSDPEASEVLQRKLYYPFGMELRGTRPVRPVVAQRYLYNGIERNDELGLDLAMFRSYDPAIGRWLQVDPLAELAPELTPYRIGFNNPISFTDPLGLFEKRGEARRYKRANGLRGRTKRTSKDKDGNKTFAFTDRDSGNEHFYGSVSAGNFSEKSSVAFPEGTLKSWEPNNAANFRDYNMVTSVLYGIADNASIMTQSLNPFQTSVRHLSGDYVANDTEKEMAFVNTTMTVLPYAKGATAVKAVSPTGMTIASRLNAAQFSKTFKGTVIARAHPKIRGYLNRAFNMGLDKANNHLQTGKTAISLGSASKSLAPSDEN
jgi:RHS repeat-associated protein